jgi:pyruvate/2-oxoglutarate/acetoin dehydrogenase E1 component
MKNGRTATYVDALREALTFAMEKDPRVFVMGIGVDDHKAVFGSTRGLVEKFGRERVFDTPISEAAMTGVAIGAAVAGLRPVHIHIRNDFLYLAMDQLMNMAAKWRYMFGGATSVPLVVRCVVGRSWGQGAQHSQNLQSMFMHVPGIKVVAPTTPADAQGLLLSAIADPNPVILFEHRLLYDLSGPLPSTPRKTPIGPAIVRRAGRDITVVAGSYMAVEALKAARWLEQIGVSAEVVDPVSLVPLDKNTILRSVKKTGRLLVADSSWITCGMSAEIAAIASEQALGFLKSPVRRLGFQPTTCPVSKPLESLFYPDANQIVRAAAEMLRYRGKIPRIPDHITGFKGPF